MYVTLLLFCLSSCCVLYVTSFSEIITNGHMSLIVLYMERFQNVVLESMVLTVRILAKVVYVKHVISGMGHVQTKVVHSFSNRICKKNKFQLPESHMGSPDCHPGLQPLWSVHVPFRLLHVI
jgi:hypothetical protein